MSDGRTVLLVSYAYPPNGSPGALRSSKLAKYLPEFGWNPVVLTPRTGFARVQGLDEGELAHVRVVRTGELGGRLRNRMSTAVVPAAAPPAIGRATLSGRLKAAALRGVLALMIPDRNLPWLVPALRAGARAVRETRPTAIFSTSPCITGHLIAMILAGRFGLPWIAEFRDAWTTSELYSRPAWRAWIERRIERRIMKRAARVVTVSADDVERFHRAYPEWAHKVNLVRNGYDEVDFAGLPRDVPERFTLVHAGSFYGGGRNPDPLFRAMAALRRDGVLTPERFELRLIGLPEAAVRTAAEERGVADLVRFTGHVPYRHALAEMTRASAVLLVTHAELSSLPVKFYDYLGARRPMLVLTQPQFELAGMVNELGVGTQLGVDDVAGVEAWLRGRLTEHAAGRPEPDLAGGAAAAFTRRAVARRVAELLDEVAPAAAAPLGAGARPPC